MSSVNLHTREIALKVVYYGPGIGGKTSSLRFIHRALAPDSRGQLVSLATGADRTLYFDFLPVKLPRVGGFAVRVQLYTVPGQVHYNSTRKLVLTGADGLVFVADSQRERMSANVESLHDLEENLREQGIVLRALPLVFQWNKRDVADPVPAAEMASVLGAASAPGFETIATRGVGIFEALKRIVALVLADLRRRQSLPPTSTRPPEPLSDGIPSAPLSAEASRSRPVPTLSSLGEVADAIDNLAPAAAPTTRTSGTFRVEGAARSLGELVAEAGAREAILQVEAELDRGDWAGAVRRSADAVRDLARRLAGVTSPYQAADPLAMAAVLTGLQAGRFLRFREAEARVVGSGAVTSQDALFALLFLADFALRAEEVTRRA